MKNNDNHQNAMPYVQYAKTVAPKAIAIPKHAIATCRNVIATCQHANTSCWHVETIYQHRISDRMRSMAHVKHKIQNRCGVFSRIERFRHGFCMDHRGRREECNGRN
jgi:hypothetical protein